MVEVRLHGPVGREIVLLGCFHVSPQNTFTGRLTPDMLDAVLVRARAVAAGAAAVPGGSAVPQQGGNPR